MQQKSKKLLNCVRDAIRVKHYAHRTEQTYVALSILIPTASIKALWACAAHSIKSTSNHLCNLCSQPTTKKLLLIY